MRIAVVSDVHGNLPALEAVLADAGRFDALLCCGDLVGFYPEVAEVVDRLRAAGVQAVRGNHERMVLGELSFAPERAGYYAIDWTRRALRPDQLRWLAGLPAALQASSDGLALEVRHASPWDDLTYLYADRPELARIALPPDRWLLLGHTHHPMRVRRGAGWVLNPGSVGQPRDWDPRAAYAILDTAARAWVQRRVAYDHRAYQRRLAALGWDERAVALLGRRRGGGEVDQRGGEERWRSRS
jgi:predicted phosphodiesterase